MWNAGLDESQAGIKTARRNINNLRYTDDTTLKAEWRRTKEPLDECERGEWDSWPKTQHSKNQEHGIWSHHFMTTRRGKNGSGDRFSFPGLQNWLSHVWLFATPSITVPTRLLCPWNSPGKITEERCHFLLQGTFPTQVSCITGRFFTIWATREVTAAMKLKEAFSLERKLGST